MCSLSRKCKNNEVKKVHISNGEIVENETKVNPDVPEHVDNPFINRNIQRGILGFRYETKNCNFVVYSSIEAKTFCMIMGLEVIRK